MNLCSGFSHWLTSLHFVLTFAGNLLLSFSFSLFSGGLVDGGDMVEWILGGLLSVLCVLCVCDGGVTYCTGVCEGKMCDTGVDSCVSQVCWTPVLQF